MARAALCAALLAGVAVKPAAADEDEGLARARAELADLRYDDALSTLTAALLAGGNRPTATAQLYLLLGEVRATLGQEDDAEKAFRLGLSIDPALELRKGVSPKISRPFRRARRAQRSAGAIAIEYRIDGSDPATVVTLVRSDPFHLVAGARVTHWGEDGVARETEVRGPKRGGDADAKAGDEELEVELPRGVSRFTIAGIDDHGNRVVELGSEEKPLAVTVNRPNPAPADAAEPTGDPTGTATAAITASPAEERTPFYAHWLLWGGVAVAAGAVGTWAGLSAQSAANELDDIRDTNYEFEFSRAQTLADRAEQRSLIANISFAAAGASALAAAILYVRSRGERTESTAALVPLVGDQVGVAATISF